MITTVSAPVSFSWPLWKKLAFRFLFVFFILRMALWTWLAWVPGLDYLLGFYQAGSDWAVHTANQYLFHVRNQLVPLNGSGDTSYGWAELWLHLSLAAIGCLIWSVLDARRPHYRQAAYWLRTFMRYYLATVALSYGILKLFALQMPFPNLSQLATPLGDFLPMRLSWLFIGYSTPYQVFSGATEVLAGLLLLYRRTVTLGLLLAAAVFTHVFVLNVCYDIPVKLFSAHLMVFSFGLLSEDAQRLWRFLVLNQPAPANHLYEIHFPRFWMRRARVAVKVLIVFMTVIWPLYENATYAQERNKSVASPIPFGLYDVQLFVRNGDTIQPQMSDTLVWKDVVFDRDGAGSVNSTDTLFRQRYHRGYFAYQPDSVAKTIAFTRMSVTGERTPIGTFRYELPTAQTVRLWARLRQDSLYVELTRSRRHFQLTERPFHWLSEYNR